MMKAVAYAKSLPIADEASLVDITLPRPAPQGRDLLVRIEAVSVNPVDTKVRAGVAPPDGGWKVLGWDAAGTVEAVGPDVTAFRPGDAVWYAGSIDRPGTNSEFHLVDERIVGPKPASLDWAAAAAMPLTAITAWELLFDRLAIPRQAPDTAPAGAGALLVIGGAGGVGSILIQLARRLTGLTVIATASRPETAAWCRDLGAHHVVDHTRPLAPQLSAIGSPEVAYIASLTGTALHMPALVEVAAPQGHIAVIDDPRTLDVMPLKRKALALHWELMFTRPLYGTPDMGEQGALLARVAELVDAGVLRSTATQTLGRIDAATLRRAHALIESGRTRGKLVLAGF